MGILSGLASLSDLKSKRPSHVEQQSSGQASPSGPENGPEVGPQLCVLRCDLHDPLPRLHPPTPVLRGGQHHEELRIHVRGHLGHNTPLLKTTTTNLILPFYTFFDIASFIAIEC